MSQEDYIAMAASLRREKPPQNGQRLYDAWLEQWKRDVLAVARTFAADNHRFKMSMFWMRATFKKTSRGRELVGYVRIVAAAIQTGRIRWKLSETYQEENNEGE